MLALVSVVMDGPEGHSEDAPRETLVFGVYPERLATKPIPAPKAAANAAMLEATYS